MELLQTGADQEKENAVHVMTNLNINEDIGACIASRGGIASLVVLTRSGTEEQRKRAVIVLRKLASINDALRTEILDEGGFTMVKTLEADGHENEQEDTIDTQKLVVIYEDNYALVEAQPQPGVNEHVSKPVIPDDTVRTGSSKDIPIKKRQSSAGSKFVFPAQNKAKSKADPNPVSPPIINATLTMEMARAKGVPKLLALLKTGTNEEKDIAVRALDDLACSAENRGDIWRQGGVELLESIRQDGTDLQKQAAAHTLRQLNPDCCALM